MVSEEVQILDFKVVMDRDHCEENISMDFDETSFDSIDGFISPSQTIAVVDSGDVTWQNLAGSSNSSMQADGQFCMTQQGNFEYPLGTLASNIRPPSQDPMRNITTLKQTIQPTGNFQFCISGTNGLLWDTNEVGFVGEVVEVVAENQQQSSMIQQQYSGRGAKQILGSGNIHNPQLYQLNKALGMNRVTKCANLDAFSNEHPMLTNELETKDAMIKKNSDEKTLAEVNLFSEDSVGDFVNQIDSKALEDVDRLISETPGLLDSLLNSCPSDNTVPLQDSLNTDSHRANEEFLFEEESTPSLLSSSDMDQAMEESTLVSIPTAIDGQPMLDELVDIVDFINSITPESLVVIPEEKPKKRARGRPRKVQTNPVSEQKTVDFECLQWNPYMSGAALPERSCKTASLQKIRSSVSEESEAGSSDQEHSLMGAAGGRKRIRKVPGRYVQDSDFEDNSSLSSGSYSPPSSEAHTEDDHQEKRRKNNDASRKSRIKRQRVDQLKFEECVELENRVAELTAKAEMLERAVSIVRDFRKTCCQTLPSVGIWVNSLDQSRSGSE